jgi:bacterioferritin
MKGNDAVIEALQNVLTAELSAINEYIVHSEMFDDWGYDRLAAMVKKDAIEEMGHAEKAIERMLFLEAKPNVAKPLNVNIGDTIPEMFKNDLNLEYNAVAHLNKCIQVAVEADDNGSRELFESILKDEEEHVDWIETQLSMIEQMGLANYLTAMSSEED